ncbi:MAG: hypothetical protein K2I10_06425 [Lachnospiraceae bacterium]|nr:hypothetical protein [Lachnospiraceae bacterium]
MTKADENAIFDLIMIATMKETVPFPKARYIEVLILDVPVESVRYRRAMKVCRYLAP